MGGRVAGGGGGVIIGNQEEGLERDRMDEKWMERGYPGYRGVSGGDPA